MHLNKQRYVYIHIELNIHQMDVSHNYLYITNHLICISTFSSIAVQIEQWHDSV